jgi:hypothetical protein
LWDELLRLVAYLEDANLKSKFNCWKVVRDSLTLIVGFRNWLRREVAFYKPLPEELVPKLQLTPTQRQIRKKKIRR